MPQTYFRPIPATGKLPAAVAFDLDKTLVDCDTTLGWLDFLYETGVVTDPIYREINRRMMSDYRRGVLDYPAWLRKAVPAYGDLNKAERDALLERFIETKTKPSIYRDALPRIEAARAAGMKLYIISASASFLVKPIGQKLFGIDGAIGTDLLEVDGHLRGEIVGTPSFRDGKIVRLREALAADGLTLEETLFFTDSRNDLPLALAVGDVECVNPDHTLREAALKHRWRSSNWFVG